MVAACAAWSTARRVAANRQWLVRWYGHRSLLSRRFGGTLFEEYPLVGVPVFIAGMGALAFGHGSALRAAVHSYEVIALPGKEF